MLRRPARRGTVIGTMATQLEGKALIFGGNNAEDGGEDAGVDGEDSVDPRLEMI